MAAAHDLVVRNGVLIIPGVGRIETDVGISGDRIATLGRDLDGAEIYDAAGKAVLPGIFDPHVHIGNELSFEEEAETEKRLLAELDQIVERRFTRWRQVVRRRDDDAAEGDMAAITIENDGRPYVTGAAGLGIENMRRRAIQLGGKLDISSLQNGIRVTLLLPPNLPDVQDAAR